MSLTAAKKPRFCGRTDCGKIHRFGVSFGICINTSNNVVNYFFVTTVHCGTLSISRYLCIMHLFEQNYFLNYFLLPGSELQQRMSCGALKVIVERYKREKLLPAMDKSKFLLPEDISVAQFSSVVRWMIDLRSCFRSEL